MTLVSVDRLPLRHATAPLKMLSMRMPIMLMRCC
jgi:hypothetical protein